MTTAEDLARELRVSGKSLRSWLRRNRPHAKGQPWIFTASEADAVRRDYLGVGRQNVAAAPSDSNRATESSGRGTRRSSDESYVIDLCEDVLGEDARRQHRFDWLRGDPDQPGRTVKLPVDAYFPAHGVVVEYRERQHTECIAHFDKPDRITVSGVHRGEQRRLYDQRRDVEIPRHDLRLVVIQFSDLPTDSAGRLVRRRPDDLEIVKRKLSEPSN